MPVATVKPTQLKRQLRDTQRLLTRPNLPADMRREQERKLAHISAMIVERVSAERIEAMKKKYAKVRFFESRKAERHLKTASRELIAENSEEKLNKWIEAKRDLVYVQAFPFDQKYISLWPSVPLTDAKTLAKRDEMRMNLASQHGCDAVSMEVALAMAQSIVDGPSKKSVKVNQVKAINQSLKRASDESEGEEEDDEDDEEEEDGDSDDSGEEESDNSDDDDENDDSGESDFDDSDEGDESSFESDDDNESDADSDSAGESEEDSDDESNDDDDEDESEEDDEEEESEEEEESSDNEPSRKRRK